MAMDIGNRLDNPEENPLDAKDFLSQEQVGELEEIAKTGVSREQEEAARRANQRTYAQMNAEDRKALLQYYTEHLKLDLVDLLSRKDVNPDALIELMQRTGFDNKTGYITIGKKDLADHVYLLQIDLTNKNERDKFLRTIDFYGKVFKTTAKVAQACMDNFKSSDEVNVSQMNEAMKDCFALLDKRPDIYAGIYGECLAEIKTTAEGPVGTCDLIEEQVLLYAGESEEGPTSARIDLTTKYRAAKKHWERLQKIEER